jgi:hypothetical protein
MGYSGVYCPGIYLKVLLDGYHFALVGAKEIHLQRETESKDEAIAYRREEKCPITGNDSDYTPRGKKVQACSWE